MTVSAVAQQQSAQPAVGLFNGNVFANGYADWSVPMGLNASLSWTATSFCTANSGGTSFPAFTVGTPITILDQNNPALNDVVTVTAVNIFATGCSISTTTPAHQHSAFSLATATAGLQEAINANLSTVVDTTVHLTADWYRAGGQIAQVSASIVGNTKIGIVDDTQVPAVSYQWNGSHYVETSVAGIALASYSTAGLQGGGRCYVYPSSISTDAFAAINACTAQLPSSGGTIDATALGTANYTVTTQLTALNNAEQAVTLLLNPGTTFTINTSFATPTNTAASCAVPVGPGSNQHNGGSAIIVPGKNDFNGNFLLGTSARVWDVVCNGDFTGNQESLRLDGVVVEGNASATMMGALLHLAGVFTPTRIANSGTEECFGQCVELDAGTTGSGGPAIGDIQFDNDLFQDAFQGSTTYPGCVLTINTLTDQGEAANINFFGGMVQLNGPHNPLLCVKGNGSVQADSIGFFGTTFQGAPATTSIYNSNVDPIQLTDVSSMLITNLRFAGTTNIASQPNLVDIFGTTQNAQFGINIDQVTGFTPNFTCLIRNTVEGTCESGFPTGFGISTLPNYTFGQIFPQIRQTNVAAPTSVGTCVNGSVWINSSDTTAGAFKLCEGALGSQAYTTLSGSGSASFQVAGTPLISGLTVNFVPGANITIANPSAGNVVISAPSPGAANFSTLGAGTSTTGPFNCSAGCSILPLSSGIIQATTMPYSGLTSVPSAAVGVLGVGSPDNVTIQTTAGVYSLKPLGANTIGGFNGSNVWTGFALGTGLGFSGSTIVNTSTANTVSGTMTPPCITLATGANSIGCSLLSDNGTQGSYSGSGGLAIGGGTGATLYQPLRPASVAGTPLPACSSANVTAESVVSDLNTTPTFWLAYAGNSGGSKTAPVICAYDGSAYAWRVY